MTTQDELLWRIAQCIDAAWDADGDLMNEEDAVLNVKDLLVEYDYMTICDVCNIAYAQHTHGSCPYDGRPDHQDEDVDTEHECPVCGGDHEEEDHP